MIKQEGPTQHLFFHNYTCIVGYVDKLEIEKNIQLLCLNLEQMYPGMMVLCQPDPSLKDTFCVYLKSNGVDVIKEEYPNNQLLTIAHLLTPIIENKFNHYFSHAGFNLGQGATRHAQAPAPV